MLETARTPDRGLNSNEVAHQLSYVRKGFLP